jgi:CheY-like chemotaxis protein
VVDDDPEVREVTSLMLQEADYDVVAVDSGQQALNCLERGEIYDLMIVDIAMPGLNGPEAVRRAREKRPELRVLYASGYADATHDDNKIADPRIKKPFRQAELIGEVRGAINRG